MKRSIALLLALLLSSYAYAQYPGPPKPPSMLPPEPPADFEHWQKPEKEPDIYIKVWDAGTTKMRSEAMLSTLWKRHPDEYDVREGLKIELNQLTHLRNLVDDLIRHKKEELRTGRRIPVSTGKYPPVKP